MYLLEFSVLPVNKGDSISPYVARCLELVDASGLDYRLHAMGTDVEGELDDLLGLLQKCLAAVTADCDRVSCSIRLDYRKGEQGRLKNNIASVEQELRRKLKS